MYNKCLKVGSSRCMIVYYEQLVLHPKMWTKQILEFLDIPWHESVLHHDEHINKPGGVVLSKYANNCFQKMHCFVTFNNNFDFVIRVERSSDQVIKPINLEALKTWVGNFPEDVLKKVPQIAPMLGRLGYDPYAVPPNYGLPDAFVQNNTNIINQNKEVWLERAKNLSSQNQLMNGPAFFNNLLSPDSANLTTTKD